MAETFTEFYCDPVSGSNLYAGSTNSGPIYASISGNWDGVSVFTPTDGSTPASTVTSSGLMFASVYLSGAVTTPYVSRINAVAAGVNGAITLSTTAKAGAAPSIASGLASVNVGGYWKGPNGTVNFPFAFVVGTLTDLSGDTTRVNFKNNAPYSVTQPMFLSGVGPAYWQGMTASPGDLGKAVLDGGTTGSGYILLTVNASFNYLRDLILQNNGASGTSDGLVLSATRTAVERVAANNLRGNGINFNNTSIGIECEAYACNQSNTANTAGIKVNGQATLARCISHHNSGSNSQGFLINSTSTLADCIAAGNGANGMLCAAASQTYTIENPTTYGNSGAGILANAINCLLVSENGLHDSNGTNGVSVTQTTTIARLSNAFFFNNNNGGAQTNGTVDDTGTVVLVATALNDPAHGDFSLNNTASGGAIVRNAARGAFTQISGDGYTQTTTSYPDGGSVQSLQSGSTGGLLVVLPTTIV